MSRRILGPFNRVEGDLEVILDLDAGQQVAAARVNSPLFRGFEQLLLGRAPLDALAIVPRICGICSVSQSVAAATALAGAMDIRPTANGARATNLILAAENLADHLSHFYLFFMPDFAHPAYAGRPWYEATASRFAALRGSAAGQALPARAGLLKLMGFLAGKWPHSLGLQPGGTTRALGASEKIRVLAQLRECRAFLETTLLGDRLEALARLDSPAALAAWAAGRPGDFPAFLALAADLGLERTGRAYDRFLSHGAYPEDGAPLFPAGFWQPDQGLAPLAPEQISEDSRHAWLVDEEGPLHPRNGLTRVEADKEGAYSWCKAPRYAGQPLEVGALARQLVAGQPLLQELVRRQGASVLARVTARMLELARVLPAMEGWARALEPGHPYCAPGTLPGEGQGAGLVEAARGSLGHWLEFRRGRISRYQVIAPTTWNFSPRDSRDQPGPLEKALEGLPAGPEAPPLVQHVVRSFDPCMACTVH
ncbi:nickel-dependent hydrogenase large subunit [Azovibrio restrictus]|uniref:nickel-dependent hydrogenase large subunit n=1 Tax=Azovibrio restrictus TaxID=146938 RepID=UPI0026F117E6|nr:nickel-dependent hydrogenase large subunit [Azovibrio restrictus]MDD3481647.1 nickel-dependent hydrogenase large subunit [Azovibrio restrictus]